MNRKTLKLFVAVCLAGPALGLLGCGGKASSGAAKSNPCSAANPCGGKNPCAGSDVSAWSSWTKINTKRFQSGDHRDAWVDVYVEPAAADAYKTLASDGKLPVGTTIVKAQYKGQSDANAMAITVMVKKAAGYNPEHGDWYYAAMTPAGTKAMVSGKVPACIECHDNYEDTDFVGGVPDEAK